MSDWRPHVVQQGEHVRKLAFQRGTRPEEVWSHAKNAELAAKRKSMDLLAPGDLLHLPTTRRPGIALRAGVENKYQAAIPTVPVHIQIDSRGPSLASQPFELRGAYGGGEPLRGTAGPNGEIDLELPVHVREVVVAFPDLGLTTPVRLGDLDPVGERSGVVARLRNLGFLAPGGTPSEDALATAIRAFQADRGMTPSGKLDQDLHRALEEVHGV
ncbi:MAG: peptidoglycan-binding protein [Polyangiaceae bacterium]|nr:peptidoglycan-binding protein [Polyangiaceae bacterium]